MIGLVLAAIANIRAYAVSRHRLALEVAARRQQLVVFKRKRPRPLMGNIDRLFWITFRHWWSAWAAALIIVKPETVASWHGSVANSESEEATMCTAGWELRGHAEDGMDELALRYSIALSYPADLTFADCAS